MGQMFCYSVVRSVLGGLTVPRVTVGALDRLDSHFPEAIVSKHGYAAWAELQSIEGLVTEETPRS
jgi:hypothetical protein